MVLIGRYNTLEIIEKAPFGLYLDGGEDGSILLPNRYVPDDWKMGDQLEVFVHYDSEDRIIASTLKPFAEVHRFAALKVLAVEEVGAFLDWGLPKDLFLPFAEQTRELRRGQTVVVYLYLDKSDRISATMRIDRHFEKNTSALKTGQEISLLIAGMTDMGFKTVVDGIYGGMIFKNEVFQDLSYAQELKGFIKQIRPDGKLDISLQDTLKIGHHSADEIAPKIMSLLEGSGGFLPVNDKTPAEEIYRLFGASKKKYKIALGGLYKKRLIRVETDGIHLIKA